MKLNNYLKRGLASLTVCSLVLLGALSQLNAEEVKDHQNNDIEIVKSETTNEKDNPFSKINPNDKVVRLPDGGFISGTGQVEIFSVDDLNNPTEIIDLDNDPNTMSVQEAFDLWESERKEDFNITTN